ncbi:serine/arginine repetitive matrix protein 1-like [Anomalospiza imberbis]|uniref:serine/arginine repetitive matrix protein 1-like n=1 Tax=Anomalospiza imberbis TaxID=187417 RepID=UPI00358FD173
MVRGRAGGAASPPSHTDTRRSLAVSPPPSPSPPLRLLPFASQRSPRRGEKKIKTALQTRKKVGGNSKKRKKLIKRQKKKKKKKEKKKKMIKVAQLAAERLRCGTGRQDSAARGSRAVCTSGRSPMSSLRAARRNSPRRRSGSGPGSCRRSGSPPPPQPPPPPPPPPPHTGRPFSQRGMTQPGLAPRGSAALRTGAPRARGDSEQWHRPGRARLLSARRRRRTMCTRTRQTRGASAPPWQRGASHLPPRRGGGPAAGGWRSPPLRPPRRLPRCARPSQARGPSGSGGAGAAAGAARRPVPGRPRLSLPRLVPSAVARCQKWSFASHDASAGFLVADDALREGFPVRPPGFKGTGARLAERSEGGCGKQRGSGPPACPAAVSRGVFDPALLPAGGWWAPELPQGSVCFSAHQ